ncbi:MAG TPA: peptidylprolyl isomerase [Burkholderiaceae bacterium]|jgi:FKBP-type peptidyl-prolyl cis-trans isomerase SlyD|nr:peptidylprolyl isomerase [Burkholderiaceae bacterium]
MNIAAPCVVTLAWRLEDTLGNLIDELDEPVEFFYGGDDLLARIEEELAGQEAGFRTRLQLEPEHAFGDYDAQLVFFEQRSVFPEGVEVGMRFDTLPDGCKTEPAAADTIYTVTEVYPDHIVLDGNHPLAGIALRLDLTVRDVRPATESEIERGSVGEMPFAVQARPANGAPRR